MNIDKTHITAAGVYRCCIASVGQDLTEVKIGDKSECKHCGERFILTGDDISAVWIPEWQLEKRKL